MRPSDVLQPILATVGHDPEHPRIEPATHLGEVLIGLDETELQDVFRDVRTTGHAQRMSIEGIAVAGDQRLECVAIPTQYALDDHLIAVFRISDQLVGPRSLLSRLHDNRVTHFTFLGQGGTGPASLLEKGRHVEKTTACIRGNTVVTPAIVAG